MAADGNAANPSTTASTPIHGLIMNTLCKIEELPGPEANFMDRASACQPPFVKTGRKCYRAPVGSRPAPG